MSAHPLTVPRLPPLQAPEIPRDPTDRMLEFLDANYRQLFYLFNASSRTIFQASLVPTTTSQTHSFKYNHRSTVTFDNLCQNIFQSIHQYQQVRLPDSPSQIQPLPVHLCFLCKRRYGFD